jgi:hypothetical protein
MLFCGIFDMQAVRSYDNAQYFLHKICKQRKKRRFRRFLSVMFYSTLVLMMQSQLNGSADSLTSTMK